MILVHRFQRFVAFDFSLITRGLGNNQTTKNFFLNTNLKNNLWNQNGNNMEAVIGNVLAKAYDNEIR